MTDSRGDGWNGNVVAIKQNNYVIGIFGDTFKNGSTAAPVSFKVWGNVEAQVVVSNYGNSTNSTS